MESQAAQLSALYEELAQAVWRYAAGQVRQAHEADEVLQDTFVVAAQNVETVCAADSPRAWLIGVARNVIRQRSRRQRRDRYRALNEDHVSRSAAPSNPRIDAMRGAIARLPDHQREALELRLASELSYAEIAAVLNIPIGTVRSRLHNAIKTLRDWAADTTETALQKGAEE